MGKMKVVKDTSLIPVEVSTDSCVHTHSDVDVRDTFLNAKIDKEIERATSAELDLQDQINHLRELGFAVRDVVVTHQDLVDYHTDNLIVDDVIVVLNDGDCSSFYRWTGTTFQCIGSSSYTVEKIDTLIRDLRAQISYLGSKSAIRDVVSTHQDLNNYNISKLVENDILVVLADELLNDATTYYKKNELGTMVLCGSVGPNYYTKREIDNIVNAIYSVLDAHQLMLEDHEVRITDNREELDDRITQAEAYDILVG